MNTLVNYPRGWFTLNTIGQVLNARFFWLRIANLYTRRNQKNCRKKNTQWIILHVTTSLSLKPACSSACNHKHARVLDLTRVWSGMYIKLLIVENESSLILQANCQPANHPAKHNWLKQYGILLICSLTSHTSIAKDWRCGFLVWQFAIIRIVIWLV